MLAAGVGISPRIKQCKSFGQNLGKCGRLIFARPDGSLGRLCDTCERTWVEGTREGMKQADTLINFDTTKIVPT